MVIDVPPASRGAGLALDRYYPIIIESDAEKIELDRFLAEPRAIPVLPNLFDHRPSNLWAESILISRYDPPEPGWPWLTVVCWPAGFTQAARDNGIAMARGCYTFEMFERLDDADVHSVALLDGLQSHYRTRVRLLSADTMATEGRA
jgi:hypothetical protein